MLLFWLEHCLFFWNLGGSPSIKPVLNEDFTSVKKFLNGLAPEYLSEKLLALKCPKSHDTRSVWRSVWRILWMWKLKLQGLIVQFRVHHQFVIKLRKTRYYRASPLTYRAQYPHFLSISNTSVTEHHSFEAFLFVHVQ